MITLHYDHRLYSLYYFCECIAGCWANVCSLHNSENILKYCIELNFKLFLYVTVLTCFALQCSPYMYDLARNITSVEVIAAYRRACHKTKAKPCEKLLKQLEVKYVRFS